MSDFIGWWLIVGLMVRVLLVIQFAVWGIGIWYRPCVDHAARFALYWLGPVLTWPYWTLILVLVMANPQVTQVVLEKLREQDHGHSQME